VPQRRSPLGLGDITGIFSRFFVVGFYLPSFFALVAVDLVLGRPEELDKTGILVLGGAALLLALLLVGFRSEIWFKFSGYWLLRKHLIGRPPEPEDHGPRIVQWLRKTKFREATREYRDFVENGWGLNTWMAWPFIEAEFSERERELHVDALATVHFFQNACLGAVAVAVAFLIRAAHDPGELRVWGSLAGFVACALLSYVLYLGAVSAVRSWGQYKIVSALKHRGDVYEHLGLRRPNTFDEELEIARAANEWLQSGGDSRPPPELRAG
jgi:hypothetical protein